MSAEIHKTGHARTIDINVVTYCSDNYIGAFLADLRATCRLNHVLRMVDNTGNPKTLTFLWNKLWKEGNSEFVAFLNPDIKFSPAWDEVLVKCLVERPEVGGVLPSRRVMGFPTPEKMAWIAAKRAETPSYADLGKHLKGFYAFVTRRSLLLKLDGFDERYRFYFQDSDFQLRSLDLGFQTTQVNHCPVAHFGKVSTREAVKRGELNRGAEIMHLKKIHRQRDAGILRPWHELSPQEKDQVRRDPVYSNMRPGGK